MHGRAYVVTTNGTLERMVQRNVQNVEANAASQKRMKVIIPKHSADAIKDKMKYKGKYVQKDSFNSFALRDHMETQAKGHFNESGTFTNKSYDIKKWVR